LVIKIKIAQIQSMPIATEKKQAKRGLVFAYGRKDVSLREKNWVKLDKKATDSLEAVSPSQNKTFGGLILG